jgi:hypothetical protein
VDKEISMDKNLVILTGTYVAAAARPVGQQGKVLTEVKLKVARPGRGGTETAETVPIQVWDQALGATLLELPVGTPLVVTARISARDWTSPTGGVKTFVEIMADSITGDLTPALEAEPVEAAPRPAARPEPARPGGTGRGRADGDVPF